MFDFNQSEFVFKTNKPSIPTDERNTIIKAINELKLANHDFTISLEKHIPHEAGLGGGSANAATVLKYLNEKLNVHLTFEQLQECAGSIGSDVPFFLLGGNCDVQGRGEIVKPLPLKLPYDILIIKPKDQAFSTKEIYQRYAQYLNDKVNVDALLRFYNDPSIENIQALENDLEKSIPDKPLIEKLKHICYDHGAFYAQMSGSGSSVFGLFESLNDLPSVEGCDVFRANFTAS